MIIRGHKRLFEVFTAATAIILLACFALGICCAEGLFGTAVIDVDISRTYQTVDGFGASSAWKYQAFGLIDDENIKAEAMNLLYGNDGLSLNIFRYNIGGGGAQSDKYWDPHRGAESFFIAERFNGNFDVFTDESNYDFSRDKGVMQLFEQALQLGNITKVVFFANSPHYLMTLNGKTHADNEKQNNLKEECYEAFANYLIVITNWIYKNVICKYNPAIEVYISPINEPQWKWGGDDASQEGCHFDPKPFAACCNVFYTKLSSFNAEHSTDFKMDILESGSYELKHIKPYIAELKKYDWFKQIDAISVHSYHADLSVFKRRRFENYAQKNLNGKNIAMSEYCVLTNGIDHSIDMGLYSAKVMLRDFYYLNTVEWSWWLSISNGDYEDGLVYWNKTASDNDFLSLTKRYYTFAHFSKFVSGATRVQSKYTSNRLVDKDIDQIAFKNADGNLVLIVINSGNSDKTIRIKGADFANVSQTVTNADVDFEQSEYAFDGNSITIGAKSITTYIFS